MALSAAFLDELRARTPLQAVVARLVKLARSGRHMKGCCPFHGEKSASFYVYEDHFHCFGCGAHGDAVSFVMQSQGATFPDAVAQLAAEAGLEVPRASLEAVETERLRHDLHEVARLVAEEFAKRLRQPEGKPARDYLERRGIRPDTIAAWGIGWSGEGRGALVAEMRGQGIDVDRLIAIGMVREGEDGQPGGELFFNRVTFPIRDPRGRTIGFGGRTLGDTQPKYLNGPETPLFSKRAVLFGHDRAREGVRGGQPVIVSEGYLDVIALHQAGFTGAVAPLGTALTDAQLQLLWRASPCPILCFDGDAAGGRAAMRAIELAMPHLTPERTLAIARLPTGEDPDSLLRANGPAAMRAVIDAAAAKPLSTFLYETTRQGTAATAEARAALRAKLLDLAGRVGDASLAREFRSAFLERLWEERRAKPATAGKVATPHRPPLTPATGDEGRMRLLLCLLLNHPLVLHDEEETAASLPVPPMLRRLHTAMLDWLSGAPDLDAAILSDHLARLGHTGEVAVLRASAVKDLPAGARPDAMIADALACFWNFVGLTRGSGLEAELGVARAAFTAHPDEANQRRLLALRRAQHQLMRMTADHDDLADAD